MKLSQLYANKAFKNIVFNDGLNLVLAKVTKQLDKNKDSHNLGKTTLISVIDFMLLKKVGEEDIFRKFHDRFGGYVFYLEIILNSGLYLTIRRSVDEPTKIAFNTSPVQSKMLDQTIWDQSNIALASAERMLNDYLKFDVLHEYDYRKSLTYFLRTQKDYNEVFQLSKFSRGKDIDWKPFIFDLLGFDGDLLIAKYKTDQEIDDQKTFIRKLQEKNAAGAEELDKIRGAITLKRSEQSELQAQIDQFNFYQQERSLNRELVEDVERAISDLNSEEYNLEFDLEKTKSSLFHNISFDIEQLKQVYSEVQVFFPDNLVSDYKDLEDFNRRITEERNKYLQEKIVNLTGQLRDLRIRLLHQNEKRDQILSVLKDKDSFRKFKTYQVDLTKVEGEIVRLEEQLKGIDRISQLNEIVDELKVKLATLIKAIGAQIAGDQNQIYPEIRRIFHNIFKYVLNAAAIIFIKQNTQGNVEFTVEVTKDNEIDVTAEGKGNTYQKLLCISFDLSVLVAYHKRSFYRFVYHDGSLEGLDNRKKANYISLVRDYCTRYNLQYIFTSIEHDLPPGLIKPNELCLTLDDSGDEGKLFGFSF